MPQQNSLEKSQITQLTKRMNASINKVIEAGSLG